MLVTEQGASTCKLKGVVQRLSESHCTFREQHDTGTPNQAYHWHLSSESDSEYGRGRQERDRVT